MRLGCLEHDEIRAAAVLTSRYDIAVPPLRVARPAWRPNPYDNLTNPTCTVCALAHSARAWSWKYGGTDVAVPVDAIDALYSRATGVPLAGIEASDGADPMMVVETAQADGWDIGGQVPLVPSFTRTGLKTVELAQSLVRAGVVMLAVMLDEADMAAARAREPWALGGTRGAVVGGHMIPLAAYDGLGPPALAWAASWGQWQGMTWEWIDARSRLALEAAWRQLLAPGVSWERVMAGEAWAA